MYVMQPSLLTLLSIYGFDKII